MTNNSTYEIRRILAFVSSKSLAVTLEEIKGAREYKIQNQSPDGWYFRKFNEELK